MLTRTIDMPLHRARTAARAILPHTSNDDVTPVLTVANVIGGNLVGTDRYSVGRYRLQEDQPEPDPASREHDDWATGVQVRYTASEPDAISIDGGFTEDLFIPRDALQKIATLNPKAILISLERFARLRIIAEGSNRQGQKSPMLIVQVVEKHSDRERVMWSQTWLSVVGNYPPVHRLVDEWAPLEDGTATFGLMPSNLAKITAFAGKHEPVKITAGAAAQKGRVMGPMKVEIGKDFLGLIQPTVILS